jgi:DinB superfamily
MPNDRPLRQHLVALLTSESAHANFDAAVANLPATLHGTKPVGAAHTPWQVLEHMRITQRDVLDRIGNANHRALGFPDASIAAFRADQKALADVIGQAELYGRTRPGADNVLLDDLLMIADHNAYHLGELILLRRLLGAWT